MAYFDIPESPKYSEEIRKFEETDPGHADVFNAVVEKLVNNDTFLKNVVETLEAGKVDKVGDTMSGKLWTKAGSSVLDLGPYQENGFVGYHIIADIEFAGTTNPKQNNMAPILMEFSKTGAERTNIIWLRISDFGTSDPKMDYYWDNCSISMWVKKVGVGRWVLYRKISENPSVNLELVRYHKPSVDSGVTITFYKNKVSLDEPEGTRLVAHRETNSVKVYELEQKMAVIEAAWEHLIWDTGGWNPFTETAPASVASEEVE